jgi:thymidylate synthase (FAD)
MKLDPLGDGKSALCLLDSMGNSLSVVNDARQSFAAESAEWTDRDGKLLRYLAKHHHTSPFRGVVFKWSVKAPLFIARQWWKHTIASTFVDDQLGWNEKSFRYCAADEAEFYIPTEFLQQSDNNRQASAGPLSQQGSTIGLCSVRTGRRGLQAGVCRAAAHGREQGASQGSAPLSAIYPVRLDVFPASPISFHKFKDWKEAQGEIVAYAKALLELGRPVAPEAFDAFAENNYQF